MESDCAAAFRNSLVMYLLTTPSPMRSEKTRCEQRRIAPIPSNNCKPNSQHELCCEQRLRLPPVFLCALGNCSHLPASDVVVLAAGELAKVWEAKITHLRRQTGRFENKERRKYRQKRPG
eukprot:6175933-Pleurochrysis_carterae.AAC.3